MTSEVRTEARFELSGPDYPPAPILEAVVDGGWKEKKEGGQK